MSMDAMEALRLVIGATLFVSLGFVGGLIWDAMHG